MRIRQMAFLTALFLGAGISSSADDTEKLPGWYKYEYLLNFEGNFVKKRDREKLYIAETIYTDIPNSPGNVAMTCVNGKLSVAVAFEPVDMKAFVEENTTTRGWSFKLIPMKIDGKRQELHKWMYLHSLSVAIPRKSSDRAKIYNSVIRGDSVILDMDFKPQIELNLPSPNQAFNEFGSACGMGILKNNPKKIILEPGDVFLGETLNYSTVDHGN